MPDSVTGSPLSEAHRAYWNATYGDGIETEEEFIELVCNQGQVLPEYKIGNPHHMQCCWLGAGVSKALLPEDRRRAQRKYMGWRPVRYMVILGNPSSRDLHDNIALHPDSATGEFVRKELRRAGIPLTECVATHVCRFSLPRTMNKYSQRHKKDGLAYLQADIDKCKPDVIITFGADALKALFGKNAKMDKYQGNNLTYETENGHKATVVPTYSQLSFVGGYAEIGVFRSELERAAEIGKGAYHRRAQKKDYRHVTTADEVVKLCDEIRMIAPPWIAFDTEFGSRCAREEFTETISIQLSWGAGTSAYIQLYDQEEVFKPEPLFPEYEPPDVPTWEEFCESQYKDPWSWFQKHPEAVEKKKAEYAKRVATAEKRANSRYKSGCEEAVKAIKWREFHEYDFEYKGRYYKTYAPMHDADDWHRIWYSVQQLLLDKRWRICAHHLRADCEQFDRNGYPLTDRIEDGIDTMLIHHLLYGDESQGLDLVVRKYLPHYGAFWSELEEYLDDTGCRKKHLDFGYRDVPLAILVPYALCDADCTWQCAEHLLIELNQQPRLKDLYFKHVSPTSWHIYQMERPGILVDDEQRAQLYEAYRPVYDALLKRVQEELQWPGFNPGSSDQMKTLLYYGAKYKDPKPPPTFDPPARLLHLPPIFNTDKYPVDWEIIIEKGEEEFNSPSAKAEALDLLHSKHPDVRVLKLLKHLSVIGKFLSTYLAPQVANEYGVVEDGKSFHCNIWADGRYSSSKANLQTKPKKQEAAAFEALVDFYFGCGVDDYKARCAADYTGDDPIEEKDQINVPKFASCFIARPGYCLIEADFATAEVYIWAYASGDEALIKLVNGGRDAHSENTLKSFKLPELERLGPALDELECGRRQEYDDLCGEVKAKYGSLRVAAKSVLFG